MSYESIYEDTQEATDEVIETRNEAWSSLEDAYVSPEPISLVSEQMNFLLAEDSEYLTTARTEAEEDARRYGNLESAFAAGGAEAAAMDAALDLANSDVQVELYEQFQDNLANSMSYSDAFNKHMEGFKAELGIQQSQFYNLLQQETQRVNFGYTLESQWYDHQYNLAEQDAKHGYDLDLKKTSFDYNSLLNDQTYGYYLDHIAIDRAIELDQGYRAMAHEQYMTTKALSTSESLIYDQRYQNIMSSNLEGDTKEALIADAYYKSGQRLNELGTWQQVGDNPYSYEDYLRELGAPPESGSDLYDTGEWYTSGGVTSKSMGAFIDTLDTAFRDEMGTKERHRFRTAQQVDWIKEYWPYFSENFKEETKAMQEWFTNVVKSGYMQADEDGYIQVVQDWRDMMMYMSIPGDEHFIPSTSPDDDGNMLNEHYSDIELIDGEIVKQYYNWQERWCKTDKYSGEETCVTEQPDFGDPDGPWENPWNDVSDYDKGYSYIMSGDYY